MRPKNSLTLIAGKVLAWMRSGEYTRISLYTQSLLQEINSLMTIRERFNTANTLVRRRTQSWGTFNQLPFPQPISSRTILHSSPHRLLWLPSGRFPRIQVPSDANPEEHISQNELVKTHPATWPTHTVKWRGLNRVGSIRLSYQQSSGSLLRWTNQIFLCIYKS